MCSIQRLNTLWCRTIFHLCLRLSQLHKHCNTSVNPFLNCRRDVTLAQSRLPLSTDHTSLREEKGKNREEHRCIARHNSDANTKTVTILFPEWLSFWSLRGFFYTTSKLSLSEISLIPLKLLSSAWVNSF